MQIANCLVALGGDKDNWVPRYGVTAAELVVLRALHGEDAVGDIEPAGEITRGNRDELLRLKAAYGSAKDEDNKAIVENVFPGSGAILPKTLADLELPEVHFKALSRASAGTAPSKAASAVAAARPADVEFDEDGVAEVAADPVFE